MLERGRLQRKCVFEVLRRVTQATKKLTAQVMAAIKTLDLVVQATQHNGILPPEAFYNELIR